MKNQIALRNRGDNMMLNERAQNFPQCVLNNLIGIFGTYIILGGRSNAMASCSK